MSLVKNIINDLIKKGADKAVAVYKKTTEEEFSVKAGEFSLLRTNIFNNIGLKIIKNNKKATISLNQLDNASLQKAYTELFEICDSSPEDLAYNISPLSGEFSFQSGSSKVDKDQAAHYLEDFVSASKEEFPKISIREATTKFINTNIELATSNELSYKENQSGWESYSLFTAQEGKNVTSMNFSGGSHNDFSEKLLNSFGIKSELNKSVALLDATDLDDKFQGDIIATPMALNFIAGNALLHLHDGKLISGSSYFKDKIGQKVLSDKLSLEILANDPDLVFKEFMTPDYFEAKNYKVFENGVLNHYLLSQYGAYKTNLEQTYNSGSKFRINSGSISLDDQIKNVTKGIMVGYFSAGQPSAKGDFSGVAKNSFLIENGKITKPLKEVMVNGNVFDMLSNINSLSKETLNSGSQITPWAHISGVNIS